MPSTPIDKIDIDGRTFYVKRDDLYDEHLSGNKFRKLHSLIQTPKENLDNIVSYGGTQSNAMLAIAKLCFLKGWHFTYYTKPLSDLQKKQNFGNYAEALKLGMKHVELDEYRKQIEDLRFNLDEKTYVIDQGGAVSDAEKGLEVLADEISTQLKVSDIRSLATPSGTGTTALFLARNMPEYKVYTTPCIGDVEYLKQQMLSLVKELPKNLVILKPKKKYHFAKLYPSFLEMYNRLLKEGIEFDLLYAPGMWEALLEQTDEEILYIHSGGVSGNKTMLERYNKKNYDFK